MVAPLRTSTVSSALIDVNLIATGQTMPQNYQVQALTGQGIVVAQPATANLIQTVPIPTHSQACGPCGDQAVGPEARSTSHMRRALKGGNINQGYAQCDVDTLAIMVERGECPVERIQCRQMALLRVTGMATGDVVTFTVDPVGPAFARELITVFAQGDGDNDTDFVPVLLQAEAQGRQAVTGTVTSDGVGNVPRGSPAGAWAQNFQNYVLPSGISFNSSNELRVSFTNAGADTGGFIIGLTYDLIRAG